MENKVEITSIKLKLKSGQIIEVTSEEARDIHSELSKLFEKEKEYVPYPIYPSYPIIIEKDYWQPNYIWASTSSTVAENQLIITC